MLPHRLQRSLQKELEHACAQHECLSVPSYQLDLRKGSVIALDQLMPAHVHQQEARSIRVFMRRVLHRFARDAGPRANALARAKEAPVAPLQSKAKELGKVTTGIGNDLSSFATGVSSGVLKGSGTGTAYAPTSPILSQVIHSPTPKPASYAPAATSTATAPAPAMARSQSLAELQQLSTSELNRMLAERGVSGHSATEKDDLAKWVHQHQHLPVISRPAAQPDASRKQSWSTHELQQKSVAELKDMHLGLVLSVCVLITAICTCLWLNALELSW
eukprot:s270_g14.t1